MGSGFLRPGRLIGDHLISDRPLSGKREGRRERVHCALREKIRGCVTTCGCQMY
jgi:hypothetical protein